MKKVFLLMSILLSLGMFCACSNDDETLTKNDNGQESESYSVNEPLSSLYNNILGEWKLVKAIPEGNTLRGINYFCFYPDTSYIYHYVSDPNVPESKTYQGKFEIVEQDNWEVPTIDYKHLPTNHYLRLFGSADFYEDFPFVIEDNIMHINVYGPTYFYTAFMFERVK